ncbi:unnamed protein product [Plasmodium vivax]|uniref:Uncharacterized protein n=2 Tax=Plasmodium vivax TaxID=5855 RepID=A0A0J9SD89_PLAVI|nr:hypothetical protein PVIIG_02137 [Plasmodium vivax India VII]CAG9479039.1 unnamed protein product [Plasmodium vivax]
MMKKNSKDLKNSSLNLSLLNGEANGGGDDEELEEGVDNMPRKRLAKLISLDRGAGLSQFKRFTRLKTFGRSGGAPYEAACQVEGDTQQLEEVQSAYQGEPPDEYPPYEKPSNTYLGRSNGKINSKGMEKREGSPKVRRKFCSLLEMIGKKKGAINYDVHKKGEAASSTGCTPFRGNGISLNKSGDEGRRCPKRGSGGLPVFTTEVCQSGGKECLYRCENGGGSLKEAQDGAGAKGAEWAYFKQCKRCDGWEGERGPAANRANRVHRSHRSSPGERNDAPPFLENIKQLLNLCDEQMKDLVQISNFEIDLDINSFYFHFVKENSDSCISTYNINHSKNIFDVKQFKAYPNEKITTYKQTSSLNWGTYVCNISLQESCYFCYYTFGDATSIDSDGAPRGDGSRKESNSYGGKEFKGELGDNHLMEELQRLYHPSGGCPNGGLEDTPVDDAKWELKCTWEGPSANREEHPLVSNHVGAYQNGEVALSRRGSEKAVILNDAKRDLTLHTIGDGEEKEEEKEKWADLHFANKSKSNSKGELGLSVEDTTSERSAKGRSGEVDVGSSKMGAFSTVGVASTGEHAPPSDVAIFLSDQSCDYQNGYRFKDNNLGGGSCMLEPGGLHEVTDESVFSGENEKMLSRGKGETSQEEALRNASTMSSSDMWNPDRVEATGSQHWEGSFKENGVGNGHQGNASMRRKSIPRQLLVKLKKMCAGRATAEARNRGVENVQRSANYCRQSSRTEERKGEVPHRGASLWENCTRMNVHSQGNSRREERDEKMGSSHPHYTRGGLNAHIQKEEIKKENHLLTNEYIDNAFDEIYYIQRINADNDSLFLFVRIYQIYIFSKKWNNHSSDGKGSAKCTNEGGTLSDECAQCKTNVSVYVLIVLKNSLLKYIIKKKILNEISSRVDKWKKHIIIKAEHIKDGSVPLCIRMIERNDDVIDYVVKNVAYFFDNYLRDFFHLLVAHVNDFFGLSKNRTLENYFQRSSKRVYHFIQKKKVHLRNVYNDIVRKSEEKKRKKKTTQGIQANQKGYTFCTCLFKRKKEHKTGDSPRTDEYSLRSSIFEPAFYYITSNEVARNYIIYMNHIYFRRILLLYLFVFIVYLVVSSCPAVAL